MSEPEQRLPDQELPRDRKGQRRAYLMQGLFVLVLLVAAVFVARSMLQTSPTAGTRPAPERQARLVDVVALQPSDYQPTVTGWGTVVPSRDLTLRAQVSGTVMSLAPQLEPGKTVSPGEELLQLDAENYRTAVIQAESALAEAQANLALEEGQQAIARREFQLLEEGSAGPGWGLETDQDDGNSRVEGLALRKPQLRIARATVEAAEARLEEARRDLERTTIKAPFEAMIGSRSVAPGAQVTTSTDIARLVGVETWWVEILVPPDRLGWLGSDDSEPAAVTLRQPGVWGRAQQRPGAFLRVMPELEDQGNLARVLVAVNDPLDRSAEAGQPPLPRLLLGSFLQADILGKRFEQVFVLEPRWLREGDQVWLMDPDQNLSMRDVGILYRDEDVVVVSAGLRAGDRLITSRLSTPAEGMPLRTEAETESAEASRSLGPEAAESGDPAREADHGQG